MPLVLFVDCTRLGLPTLPEAREALEARGWETQVMRRDAEALTRSPVELLARAADADLTVTVGAPERLVRLVRDATDTPLVAARLDPEGGRDRLVS